MARTPKQPAGSTPDPGCGQAAVSQFEFPDWAESARPGVASRWTGVRAKPPFLCARETVESIMIKHLLTQ
jgi:hypothetical protein